MNKEIKNDKIKPLCKCMCHRKGMGVMHMMVCYEHTYEKYINEDGSIDQEVLNKLNNKTPL